MTSYRKTLMLAAAACAIAAGNAGAQTYRAEIPFAFRAGYVTMAPGTYDLSFQGTVNKFLVLRSTETSKAIVLQTAGITGERKGGSVPRLRFECTSRCSLESMWVGGWLGAYRLPTPRLERNETARVINLELTHVKAD